MFFKVGVGAIKWGDLKSAEDIELDSEVSGEPLRDLSKEEHSGGSPGGKPRCGVSMGLVDQSSQGDWVCHSLAV